MNPKRDGWFALFCTADVPLEQINDILTKACDGASDAALKRAWYFWLATDNFEDALPHSKRPDGSDRLGTEAPVKSYTSPFLGTDVNTLAAGLAKASDKAYLNRVYFAVMDERTKEDGSLMLCYADDRVAVDSLRAWPNNSSLYFRGMEASTGTWDELKHSWEFHKEQGGGDVID